MLKRQQGKHERFVWPGQRGGHVSPRNLLFLLQGTHPALHVHGFRASFTTWANDESEYMPEMIDHALGHQVSDANESAYNRSTMVRKRYELMQDWANYCTGA